MKKMQLLLLVATCLLLQGCATTVEKGVQAYYDKNYNRAAELLNKPATDGDQDAQNILGILWLNGYGSTPKNYNEALAWFLKAANQGDPYAINNIGVMYENGFGVPTDIEKAVAWYTLAARKGLQKAQTSLTKLGRPVPASDLVPQQVQQSGGGSDAALMLLISGASAYQQGKAAGYQSAPMPTPSTIDLKTNCTSRTIGSTVYTDCH